VEEKNKMTSRKDVGGKDDEANTLTLQRTMSGKYDQTQVSDQKLEVSYCETVDTALLDKQ